MENDINGYAPPQQIMLTQEQLNRQSHFYDKKNAIGLDFGKNYDDFPPRNPPRNP